jgi:hypothetical protein
MVKVMEVCCLGRRQQKARARCGGGENGRLKACLVADARVCVRGVVLGGASGDCIDYGGGRCFVGCSVSSMRQHMLRDH